MLNRLENKVQKFLIERQIGKKFRKFLITQLSQKKSLSSKLLSTFDEL